MYPTASKSACSLKNVDLIMQKDSWVLQMKFSDFLKIFKMRKKKVVLAVELSTCIYFLATQKKTFLLLYNFEAYQELLVVTIQDSYMQVREKFKDFSRASKRLFYHFQGQKTMKNTDSHVKNLPLKFLSPLL